MRAFDALKEFHILKKHLGGWVFVAFLFFLHKGGEKNNTRKNHPFSSK